MIEIRKLTTQTTHYGDHRVSATPEIIDQLNTLHGKLTPGAPILTEPALTELLQDGLTTILVAIWTEDETANAAKGVVVGTATVVVSPDAPGTGSLQNVIVLEEFRRQRHGLLLTMAAIMVAQRREITTFDLVCSHRLRQAHGLFRGLGWCEVGSDQMTLNPTSFTFRSWDTEKIFIGTLTGRTA